MPEETQQTVNPIVEPQPQVVTPPVVNQVEVNPEVPGKKSRAPFLVLAGIVIVLVGFAAAIVILNSSMNDEDSIPSPTATTVSTEINNTSDLDKVAEELDTSDLDSYEMDLSLNDSDADSF